MGTSIDFLWSALQFAAMLLALWLLLAIVGWLLHGALRRFAPDGLRMFAERMFSTGRLRGGSPGTFIEAISTLHERTLSGASVRSVMERRHKLLEGRLRGIRADFDNRMRRLSDASDTGAAPTLIGLLQSFKRDVAIAADFGVIEDDLVDREVDLAKQRLRLILSIAGSVLVAAMNSLLLWIFFRDLEVGVFIPTTRIDVMMVFPFLLPVVEFLIGFFYEFLDDGEKAPGRLVLKWFVIAGLAMIETFIFFLLFRNILENAELTDFLTYGVVAACFVGPALTLFQAMVGAGAGKALRKGRDLKTEQSIKQQVVEANEFVEGLPARYDAMGASARGAVQAIDQLALDLHGRDEANLPIASQIAEQRQAFVDAIDGANPKRWDAELDGGIEDARDVVRYAWMLPVSVAALAVAFVFVVHGFMDALSLFGAEAEIVRWCAAVGAAAGCLVAGSFTFAQTGTATVRGGRVRDVLFPRDDLTRIVAFCFSGLLAIAVLSVGVAADGWMGAIEGIFAVAVGAGLVLLGGYVDLVARGLGFLGAAAVLAGVALALAVASLIVTLGIGLAALIFATVYVVSFVLGWPIIATLEARRSRSGSHGAASMRTAS